MKNFAMTGVAGYIAPRHLRAIHNTGNRLVAATDPHDSVGILDAFFPNAFYFREFERFDRFIEKQRRARSDQRVAYLSICSPNYLHDAHIRLALREDADAICEKPLVLNPWNCDALEELEADSDRRVYTVLQLRYHPAILALRDRVQAEPAGKKHDVSVQYVTSRGPWYQYSWKGNQEQSGGLATNIGVHFFDMLIWVFGPVKGLALHQSGPTRCVGELELEQATVRWLLSIDANDLPVDTRTRGQASFRSISVDGAEVEFTDGFTDLHTRVYEAILAGQGYGIAAARPAIELVHSIRNTKPGA